MRVLAIKDGFYGGPRRRAGTEFEMADADIPRVKAADGVEIYQWPKWARPAVDVYRRLFAKQQAQEQDKFLRAAVASSGTAGQKAKEKSFTDAMRDGSDADAEAAIAASGSVGHKAKKAAYEAARDAGRGPQTVVK